MMSDQRLPQGLCNQHVHQCLLFIVHKGRPEDIRYPANSSKPIEVEGFALFPEAIKDKLPQIGELSSSLQIIQSNQAYPSLEAAVKDDRVEIVEMLIDEDAITSQRSPHSKYFFAERYNNDVIDVLFDGKNSVQFEAKIHTNNICSSLVEENVQLIKHLLSLRAEIRYRHAKGGTFLHLAVERGDKALVQLLLSHGTNVAAARNDGSTALHLAAQKGHMSIISVLLNSGANLNAKMKDGSTPLHLAVENGHILIVRSFLRNGAFINATALSSSCLGGATPLHIAIEKKNCSMVKLLLENGANVNAEAFFGITVLQLAIEQGSHMIVENVLSYCPDINNSNNKKAFKLAVCCNDKEYDAILKLLLDSGLTVEPADVGNAELLLGAIRKNSIHIVKKLLEYGLQVNEMLGNGFFSETPLHTAARYSHEEMVQLLLDAGASPTATCGKGNTPVDDAFENVNLKALKVFVANGVHNRDDHDLFLKAAEEGWIEIIQSLLDHSPRINVETIKQQTLIFIAARRGHSRLIQFALKHGTPIDIKEEEDRTPLHVASAFGCPRVVEVLLRSGADVDAKCCRGRTPLFDAARAGDTEIVEVLLKFGARIDFKDVNGRTALHEAAGRGFHQCLRTLLEYNFTNPAFISFVYQPDRSLDLAFRHQLMKMLDVEGGLDRSRRRNDLYFGCVEIFARHAIKTVAANLWTDDKCTNSIWRSKEVSPSDCRTEIEDMKTATLGDTNISFHDVFTGNPIRIACYARNASIVQILSSDDYKRRFPQYANVIRYQFQKGALRKELLQDGTKICGILFDQHSVLPDDVKEKILNYLGNKDLIVLVNAFQPEEPPEAPSEPSGGAHETASQVGSVGLFSRIFMHLLVLLPITRVVFRVGVSVASKFLKRPH